MQREWEGWAREIEGSREVYEHRRDTLDSRSITPLAKRVPCELRSPASPAVKKCYPQLLRVTSGEIEALFYDKKNKNIVHSRA